MKTVIFLCLFLVASIVVAEDDLASYMWGAVNPFVQSPEHFVKKDDGMFRWEDKTRTLARYSSPGAKVSLMFLGLPVSDASIEFKNRKPSSFTVDLYDKTRQVPGVDPELMVLRVLKEIEKRRSDDDSFSDTVIGTVRTIKVETLYGWLTVEAKAEKVDGKRVIDYIKARLVPGGRFPYSDSDLSIFFRDGVDIFALSKAEFIRQYGQWFEGTGGYGNVIFHQSVGPKKTLTFFGIGLHRVSVRFVDDRLTNVDLYLPLTPDDTPHRQVQSRLNRILTAWSDHLTPVKDPYKRPSRNYRSSKPPYELTFHEFFASPKGERITRSMVVIRPHRELPKATPPGTTSSRPMIGSTAKPQEKVHIEDLKEFFSDKDGSFENKPEVFGDNGQMKQFRWLSTNKTSAHYSAAMSAETTFLMMSVYEAVIDFKEGQFNRMNISLFNRGDAGNESYEKFKAMVAAAEERLTKWIGEKPKENRIKPLTKHRVELTRGKDVRISTQGYTKTFTWKYGKSLIELSYGITKVKANSDKFTIPEYLRVNVWGKGVKGNTRTTVSARELSKFVVRDESGNVYIKGIPMVDQGTKGYCAACVTSRMLKYYGSDVDQHTIAQMAFSSASGGTDVSIMFDKIELASKILRLKLDNYYKIDEKKVRKLITSYNHEAKKEGLPPFGGLGQINPKLWRTLRTEKHTNYFEEFERNIKNKVEKGIPIVWGVQLGLYREGGAAVPSGGHMRLIIGYNNKTGEIIYSDTWGAEPKLKKLSLADAWAMTFNYSVLLPRAY